MYLIRYRKSAAKSLSKAPAGIRARVVSELAKIAEDPFAHNANWKSMTDSPYWRLRVGAWRAVCELRKGELILLVLEFGARGDVYK